MSDQEYPCLRTRDRREWNEAVVDRGPGKRPRWLKPDEADWELLPAGEELSVAEFVIAEMAGAVEFTSEGGQE